MGLRIVTDGSKLNRNSLIAVGVGRYKALRAQIKGAFTKYVTSAPGAIIRIVADAINGATIFITEQCWRLVASYPQQWPGSMFPIATTDSEFIIAGGSEVLIVNRTEAGGVEKEAAYQWSGYSVTAPRAYYADGSVESFSYVQRDGVTYQFRFVNVRKVGGAWIETVDVTSSANVAIVDVNGTVWVPPSLYKSTASGWQHLYSGDLHYYNEFQYVARSDTYITLVHGASGQTYGPVQYVDWYRLPGIGHALVDNSSAGSAYSGDYSMRIVAPTSSGTWSEIVPASEKRYLFIYSSAADRKYIAVTSTYRINPPGTLPNGTPYGEWIDYDYIDYFTVHDGVRHLAVSVPVTKFVINGSPRPITEPLPIEFIGDDVEGPYFPAATTGYLGVFRREEDGTPTELFSRSLPTYPYAYRLSESGIGFDEALYAVAGKYFDERLNDYVYGPSYVVLTHPGGAVDMTGAFGGGVFGIADVVTIGADFGVVVVGRGSDFDVTHYLLSRTYSGWNVLASATFSQDAHLPGLGGAYGGIGGIADGASCLYNCVRFGMAGVAKIVHGDGATVEYVVTDVPYAELFGDANVFLLTNGGDTRFYDSGTRTTFGDCTEFQDFEVLSSFLVVRTSSGAYVYYRSGGAPALFAFYEASSSRFTTTTTGTLVSVITAPDPDTGAEMSTFRTIEMKDGVPTVTFAKKAAIVIDNAYPFKRFFQVSFDTDVAMFSGGAPAEPVHERAYPAILWAKDTLSVDPGVAGCSRYNMSTGTFTYDIFKLS